MTHGRLIYMTHADVSLIHTGDKDALARFADSFNRAPADPAEAVNEALRAGGYNRLPRPVHAVLAALGMPTQNTP